MSPSHTNGSRRDLMDSHVFTLVTKSYQRLEERFDGLSCVHTCDQVIPKARGEIWWTLMCSHLWPSHTKGSRRDLMDSHVFTLVTKSYQRLEERFDGLSCVHTCDQVIPKARGEIWWTHMYSNAPQSCPTAISQVFPQPPLSCRILLDISSSWPSADRDPVWSPWDKAITTMEPTDTKAHTATTISKTFL